MWCGFSLRGAASPCCTRATSILTAGRRRNIGRKAYAITGLRVLVPFSHGVLGFFQLPVRPSQGPRRAPGFARRTAFDAKRSSLGLC